MKSQPLSGVSRRSSGTWLSPAGPPASAGTIASEGLGGGGGDGMAVAAAVFNETQRATLEALCETFVPSVEADTRRPPRARVHGAARRWTCRLPAQIEEMLADAMIPDEIAAVGGPARRARRPGLRRRCRSRGAPRSSTAWPPRTPQAKLGLDQLQGLTLLLFYALPDDDGRTPTGRRSATRARSRPPPRPRRRRRRSTSRRSAASRPR